jgi:hypothetical protein
MVDQDQILRAVSSTELFVDGRAVRLYSKLLYRLRPKFRCM